MLSAECHVLSKIPHVVHAFLILLHIARHLTISHIPVVGAAMNISWFNKMLVL
jgi:hypothetical protein